MASGLTSTSYPEAILDAQRVRVITLICATSVFWHVLTTFADEVRLVWRFGPLRINAVLFTTVRYLSVLSFGARLWALFEPNPTPSLYVSLYALHWLPLIVSRCRASALFAGCSSLVIIVATDLILLIRLWALYERRTSVLTFLLIACLATVSPMLVFGVRWLSQLQIVPIPPSTALTGCHLSSPILDDHWEIYPFTIAFNSLLLIMTISKSISAFWYSNEGGVYGWHGVSPTTISSLLLRDGILSYLVVLLALLFTAFGVFIPGCKMIAIRAGVAPAILSIVTCQLQLNLRNALLTPTGYIPRFCTCSAARSPTPSRSTLFSFLRVGGGVTHHLTCPLASSSSVNDRLFASTTASFASDCTSSFAASPVTPPLDKFFHTSCDDKLNYGAYNDCDGYDDGDCSTTPVSIRFPQVPPMAHV